MPLGSLGLPCCRRWRSVAQRRVWTLGVVQLGYKTPIKPAFEKCVIAGIHGMDNQYAFEPKRDEAGV
jgi:hypothetical protein